MENTENKIQEVTLTQGTFLYPVMQELVGEKVNVTLESSVGVASIEGWLSKGNEFQSETEEWFTVGVEGIGEIAFQFANIKELTLGSTNLILLKA